MLVDPLVLPLKILQDVDEFNSGLRNFWKAWVRLTEASVNFCLVWEN